MSSNPKPFGSFIGYRPRRYRRGRSGRARMGNTGQSTLGVSELAVLYLLALVAFITALALVPVIAFVLYLPVGMYLSRHIGLRVSWWDQSDNLANVSGAKIRLIISWPLSVPVFLAQMFVAKFL